MVITGKTTGSGMFGQSAKPMSIIVDGDLHDKFKRLCKSKCMKIGAVIEDLIKLYLNNPQHTQKMIDDLKEKQR